MKIILVIMVIAYVISCLFLILVILGQEGKGGGLSGLAGASALGDTFGASAAESTLRRWTRNTAILFIVLSLGLTLAGSYVFKGGSLLEQAAGVGGQIPPPTEELAPTPGPGTVEDVGTSMVITPLETPTSPPTPVATTPPAPAPATTGPAIDTGPGLGAGPTSPTR